MLIPEKRMVVGGNAWKLKLEKMTRRASAAHRSSSLAKCSRERVEDIHGWLQPLDQSFIAALRLIQFIGFIFQYVEDLLGRIAASNLSSKRVGSEIFSGLFFILF